MALMFKAASEQQEYEKYAHPDLKEEVERFVRFSEANILPWPIVTCAGRTPDENAGTPGSAANSGHLLDPASGDTSFEDVDFRIRHYNTTELKIVLSYWQTRHVATDGKVYIVNNLNHGTAPHLHVGVRIHKEK